MDKTYLKFEQIGMSFRRGQMATEVLRDIDLSIAQGEFVSMIGHSGCGKSTLLNILGGLLKSTTGEVFLEGKVVDEPGPDRAIVFQNHSLLPWLTVYGNVAIAVDKVFGSAKSKAERHDWVMHNLELVQMAQAKDKRPHEVSGGMKQRVGIARALAMQPKVLLMDEPFGALDALTRAHLQDSVMEIHAQARQHRADDHPRRRRGGAAVGPHGDDDQRAGRHDRRDPEDRPAAAAAQARARHRPRIRALPRGSAGIPVRAAPGADAGSGLTRAMSEFDDQQKQWLQGFVSGIEARKAADRLASRAPQQKQWLQGFVSGIEARKAADKLASRHLARRQASQSAPMRCNTPPRTARWRRAASWSPRRPPSVRAIRSTAGTRWWARAEAGQFPKGIDVFLTKYQGLFYVAPAQDSFMCRLRIPNGIFNAWQMRGLADAADSFGGGYADVTTRANLQIREIGAAHAVDMLLAVQALGLTSRGSGADNIRNITGSPTAGIDPQEIYDTRPLCSAMHHYILNHREMYGLPRKFNIAFDGGGRVPVLEDTNDIGFVACQVTGGAGFEPGVYFRLQLGGITGHLDFAFETGILLKPEECVKVAGAVVRAFIAHGDRTNRLKARLKYVLDRMGREAFIAEVEKEYGSPLRRAAGADGGAAADGRQARTYRRLRPEAGRPQLSRAGAAGRPADVGANARPRRDLRALRQRHAPTHGVAEPADLRCRRP